MKLTVRGAAADAIIERMFKNLGVLNAEGEVPDIVDDDDGDTEPGDEEDDAMPNLGDLDMPDEDEDAAGV